MRKYIKIGTIYYMVIFKPAHFMIGAVFNNSLFPFHSQKFIAITTLRNPKPSYYFFISFIILLNFLYRICADFTQSVHPEKHPREADGTPNWHKIDSISNLDHCLEHAFNFLSERNKPDKDIKKMREELSHCAARSLMALEMFIKENQ